jgi:glycosyltransferase involved in cell wall biosynthesis
MACGTPVAAFPVPGPLDVVGDASGGVLHEDLRTAALQALRLPRHEARARALRFDWNSVCEQFLKMVVPAAVIDVRTVAPTTSTRKAAKS